MGQKVNPVGFRIGVFRDWFSRWFARGSYAGALRIDRKIREHIAQRFKHAEISHVEVEMAGQHIRVVLHSGRVGVVIGKKGQEIEALRSYLTQKVVPGYTVDVSVQEVKKPEISAAIVAQSIADQLEQRVSYKKAMKKAVTSAVRAGAKGVKVRIAGRIGGAEIARDEIVRVGSIPLHTLRANVDYALAEAQTTYGIIGVKVWIYLGEFKTPQAVAASK